jgi:polyhydroxyalkanoate synthesis regulator phasin
MVFDVSRGYLSVAEGLTDISIQRARVLAESVVTHSSFAADKSSEQISAVAEDLMKQSQTNRDLLIGLIRTEIDRTVGRMGFVREEELAAVRSHVHRLEAQIKALQSGASGVAAMSMRPAAGVVAKVTGPSRSSAPAPAPPEPVPPAAAAAPAPAPPAKKAPAKRPARKRTPPAGPDKPEAAGE